MPVCSRSANFVTRTASAKPRRDRPHVDQQRYFDVKADVDGSLVKLSDADGNELGLLRQLEPDADTSNAIANAAGDTYFEVFKRAEDITESVIVETIGADDAKFDVTIQTNGSRLLTEWLETSSPCPLALSIGNGLATRKKKPKAGQFLMHRIRGRFGSDVHHPFGAIQ